MQSEEYIEYSEIEVTGKDFFARLGSASALTTKSEAVALSVVASLINPLAVLR